MASALTQQVCAHACPRKTVLSNPIKLLCITAVFVHSPLSDFVVVVVQDSFILCRSFYNPSWRLLMPSKCLSVWTRKAGQSGLSNILEMVRALSLSLFPTPELTLDANPFPQGFLLSLPITSSSGLIFESLIHDRPASSSQKRFL